ncbi:hypothetical protein TRVL_06328 [Trypanosoma vivax]|nr:hypothetical protein TRVL_06328 [Trypanosoma vivax]
MEAGLKRLVGAIKLSKTRRTRVVAFTGSLSLLMALSAGPAAVEGAILKRIWDIILCIVGPRVSVIFQFVFSQCGVPRSEAADKAAEQGNAKPQPYPACVADIVTGGREAGAERDEQGLWGGPDVAHASQYATGSPSASAKALQGGSSGSLLAQFRTCTSKHFGWLHRVLTRQTDQVDSRWCSTQAATSEAKEEHPLREKVADSETAPDLGIATRQRVPFVAKSAAIGGCCGMC